MVLVFRDGFWVSLTIPGWPQTHREPSPAPVSQALGLKACTINAWLQVNSLFRSLPEGLKGHCFRKAFLKHALNGSPSLLRHASPASEKSSFRIVGRGGLAPRSECNTVPLGQQGSLLPKAFLHTGSWRPQRTFFLFLSSLIPVHLKQDT